jgi:hypothetical protein
MSEGVQPVNIVEFEVALPECARHSSPENVIKTPGPLVVVGANGAGKSRLAEWIERRDPARCHRLSAQRALSFPDDFRATSIDEAESELLFGHKTSSKSKFGMRWTKDRHDQLLNDFQKLVTLLFSEGSQVREEYVQRMKHQTTYEEPPERKLDIIQRIWQEVLPRRELVIGGNKVEARRKGETDTFAGREMSDGERVIFYLVGQCLSAPKNGIILIDEPELHLHRALQTRLWDALEAERNDCLFVYLTHDLDFAASRAGGTHIWLTEYGPGDKWEWDFVPTGTSLPEALLLEVLGSRKPILFVEGESEGPDEQLYRLLYPGHHVIAFGGCGQIIHAVGTCKNLRLQGQVDVETLGLIDRDGRSTSEVESLNAMGVSVLEWAEIENLLVYEEVIREVAKALHLNADDAVRKAKDRVSALLRKDLERVATTLAGRDLDRRIREWPWKHADGATLEASLNNHVANLKPGDVVASSRTLLQGIVDQGAYEKMLRVYPHKGLPHEVGKVVGLHKYIDFVLRHLMTKEGATLLSSLQALVPKLASPPATAPPSASGPSQ